MDIAQPSSRRREPPLIQRRRLSNRFEGKAALITGAARGQGRSHAVALAREGANIAICDIVEQIEHRALWVVGAVDLEETSVCAKPKARRSLLSVPTSATTRRSKRSLTRRSPSLGQIHILIPNAGIFTFGTLTEMSEDMFDDMIDTNLRGCWHAIKAVVPHMAEHQYGRVVIIGSSSSLIGYPNVGHYTAAKHGVLGYEVAGRRAGRKRHHRQLRLPHRGPHDDARERGRLAAGQPRQSDARGGDAEFQLMNAIPRPWLEAEDVTKLVLFLASDDSMYMTGGEVKIDMGLTAT